MLPNYYRRPILATSQSVFPIIVIYPQMLEANQTGLTNQMQTVIVQKTLKVLSGDTINNVKNT